MTRFWSKVTRVADGCWEWTGAKTPTGYGNFRINGTTGKAHRVAWELSNGPIANGLCVCHTCDKRACVNPDHLFIGTQADNISDMCRKNRQVKAEDSKPWLNKLTADQVRSIRALMAAGGTLLHTARLYDVHSKTIRQILDGITYKHVV